MTPEEAQEIAAAALHQLDDADYLHPELTARAFNDAVEQIAPRLAEAIRAAVEADRGLVQPGLVAQEIVDALEKACDEHGPIAPRYSVEIITPIIAAALRGRI